MTPKYIECFLVLAEKQNFCMAATHLRMNIPKLKNIIREIEKIEGGQVYKRNTPQFELSEFGKGVVEKYSKAQTSNPVTEDGVKRGGPQ